MSLALRAPGYGDSEVPLTEAHAASYLRNLTTAQGDIGFALNLSAPNRVPVISKKEHRETDTCSYLPILQSNRRKKSQRTGENLRLRLHDSRRASCSARVDQSIAAADCAGQWRAYYHAGR